MTAVTVLGMVAAACTMSSFVPQVVKTWRSGSSADLSIGMYALLTVGAALWLAYGLAIRDLPVIVTNFVTLALLLMVDFQIWWHRRRPA
ncbi:SemiSWEET family sugar transporter [Rubrivirga sp. IMCC43871]|uniref:SemiSWEET family sugar transporter n=1 Tax=Rubrivirga sp. IMCC43871 TaxID=3391575 RepID=UPI00398FD479